MAQRVVPVAVYDFKHFGRPRQIRSLLEEAGVKYEFVKVYAGADEDIVLQKHKVVVPANAPLNMFTHNSYKIYRIQGGDGSHIMEVLDWYYRYGDVSMKACAVEQIYKSRHRYDRYGFKDTQFEQAFCEHNRKLYDWFNENNGEGPRLLLASVLPDSVIEAIDQFRNQ